jgi:hypothetical protein
MGVRNRSLPRSNFSKAITASPTPGRFAGQRLGIIAQRTAVFVDQQRAHEISLGRGERQQLGSIGPAGR